jgi:hypothetical protein
MKFPGYATSAAVIKKNMAYTVHEGKILRRGVLPSFFVKPNYTTVMLR